MFMKHLAYQSVCLCRRLTFVCVCMHDVKPAQQARQHDLNSPPYPTHSPENSMSARPLSYPVLGILEGLVVCYVVADEYGMRACVGRGHTRAVRISTSDLGMFASIHACTQT